MTSLRDRFDLDDPEVQGSLRASFMIRHQFLLAKGSAEHKASEALLHDLDGRSPRWIAEEMFDQLEASGRSAEEFEYLLKKRAPGPETYVVRKRSR